MLHSCTVIDWCSYRLVTRISSEAPFPIFWFSCWPAQPSTFLVYWVFHREGLNILETTRLLYLSVTSNSLFSVPIFAQTRIVTLCFDILSSIHFLLLNYKVALGEPLLKEYPCRICSKNLILSVFTNSSLSPVVTVLLTSLEFPRIFPKGY